MMKYILTWVALLLASYICAQEKLELLLQNDETKETVAGATVLIIDLKQQQVSDSLGRVTFASLRKGTYKLEISHIGYITIKKAFTIPNNAVFLVLMEKDEEEEEEVIVQSTRTSRSIKNIPTRVETISLEEIDEKSNMRPANVSMLLHESTGIQVQQTSATSGNASIRIQGLDGRYTQLLKDGFANYGNFASGLSVLEIPPLDLKQVEILKGPASTLYGGGAIGGVVNFISKTPTEAGEHLLLLNQSSIGQSNAAIFSAKRNKKVGYSVFASVNNQTAFDVDKDDFTELPKTFEWSVNPKLFLYLNERTTLTIGNAFSKANREGGDVQVIKNEADGYHIYYEENNTIRNNATVELDHKISELTRVTIKQSYSVFDRHISIPNYHFDGISYNSFTDISFLTDYKKHTVVTGVNLIFDRFNEKTAADRDQQTSSQGFYIQDNWDISDIVKIESGLRLETARFSNSLAKRRSYFALPRLSVLINYNSNLTSRIGGGLGYKMPTLFTERTETFQYQNVLAPGNLKPENSYGGTADINLKKRLSAYWDFAINHLFFLTRIDKALVLQENAASFDFVNANRPIISKGTETNLKLIYRNNYKLFLGYTYTDARAKYLALNSFLPLVPKHKFNSALIYEKAGFLKLGFEAYYTSSQYLFNGQRTPSYWELGVMAEKPFKKVTVFINFENFTDVRQSNYKRVANDPHSAPTFDDIWTHTEGFSVNGGMKVRL